MNKIRKIILGTYGFMVFIIFPMMIGDIYRGEVSINVLNEAVRIFQKDGILNTIWVVIKYLVFYSSFTIVPFVYINKYLKGINIEKHRMVSTQEDGTAKFEAYYEKVSSEKYAAIIVLWAVMMVKPLKDFLIYLEKWSWWHLIVFSIVSFFAFKTLLKFIEWSNNDKEYFKPLKSYLNTTVFLIILFAFLSLWWAIRYGIVPEPYQD